MLKEPYNTDYGTIFFTKEHPVYGCFSNFSPHSIEFKTSLHIHDSNVRVFPTSEHAYQAAKIKNYQDYLKVCKANTPGEAKKLARNFKMHSNWDDIKNEIMLCIVYEKFKQNKDIQKILLDTGGRELVEYCPWGDTYWGVDKNHKGQNNLGKILMEVREILQEEAEAEEERLKQIALNKSIYRTMVSTEIVFDWHNVDSILLYKGLGSKFTNPRWSWLTIYMKDMKRHKNILLNNLSAEDGEKIILDAKNWGINIGECC